MSEIVKKRKTSACCGVIILLGVVFAVVCMSIVLNISRNIYFYPCGEIDQSYLIGSWRIQSPSYKSAIWPNWKESRILFLEDGTCRLTNVPEPFMPINHVDNKDIPEVIIEISGYWSIEKPQRSLENNYNKWCVRLSFTDNNEYIDIPIVDSTKKYRLAKSIGDPDHGHNYIVWIKN